MPFNDIEIMSLFSYFGMIVFALSLHRCLTIITFLDKDGGGSIGYDEFLTTLRVRPSITDINVLDEFLDFYNRVS